VSTVGPIPAGLFFAAGSAAAFNPCGIAMLPAYLALLLGRGSGKVVGWPAGLAAGVAMTGGFLTVFGLVGLVGSAAIPLLGRVLPYVGVALGLGLVALGVLLLAGKASGAQGFSRLADRLAPAAGSGVRGAYLYGLAYALGSLGCAFPLFAALMAGSLASGSWVAGVQAFALYGIGMGTVVTLVSVAATVARQGVERAFARALPWLERASGGVVAAMGLYLLGYWLGGPGLSLLRG
jgi:cytochrome c-type biogenesis protein